MPDDSIRTGERHQTNGFGCFGMIGIAFGIIIIAMALLSQFHELARLVNILLNPIDFFIGIADGFLHATSKETIFRYIVIPIVAISIALGVIGFITLALALAVSSIRARAPCVFISYHHSLLKDANHLSNKLSSGGIRATMIQYITAAEHDQLLDEIYSMLRRAHFLVCLPGPAPSFLDGEVSAAIYGRKPVFFLLAPEHNGIPNTAQHSYPVIRLDRLQASEFSQLIHLLKYLHGSFASTFRLYFTPTRIPHLAEITKSGLSYIILILVAFVLFSTMFSNLKELILLNAKIEGFLFGIALGAISILVPSWLILTLTLHLSAGGFAAIRNRNIAIRQTRRMLKNGRYSYDTLHRLFRVTKGLLFLLRPFFRKAQFAHHEVSLHSKTPSAFKSEVQHPGVQ